MVKKRGKAEKSIKDYLEKEESDYSESLESYSKSPATSFLKFVCNAHYSIEYCRKYFQKNNDSKLNKDALKNLRILSTSILPAIMGQFETFQKVLFAQMFEYSRYFDSFDIDVFKKSIEKNATILIDFSRLSVYRGLDAPVGLTLADSLPGWHDPEKVNYYFSSILKEVNFFSNKEIEELNILWQLRHSIVHTGGWITRPDAQKVPQLTPFSDSSIVFEEPFISALGRKFHTIVKATIGRIGPKYQSRISSNAPARAKGSVTKLFEVDSSMRAVWL